MSRLIRIAALMVFAAQVAVAYGQTSRPATRPTTKAIDVKTGQYAQSFPAPDLPSGELKYLISIPADYAAHGPWPVLLYLHGAGERGDKVDNVKAFGPPAMIASGRKVPAIVVSPLCSAKTTWETKIKLLEALLDDIQDRYNVDKNRFYLAGTSMGARGAWMLALDQPQRYAAIVDVSGRKIVGDVALIKDIPAWIFHGGKDPLVPPQDAKDNVAAIEAAGGSVHFTLYPDLNHGCWGAAYKDEGMWTWLFEQSRGGKR